MISLLKLNFRNLFKQKFFYVFLIINTLIGVLSRFIFFSEKKPLVFPEIRTFLAAEIGVVGVIFIVIFSLFEISEGTIKNIVARGYKRSEIIISKYISTVIALFIINLVGSLLIFLLYVKNGLGFDSNFIYSFISYIFILFAQSAFVLGISFIIGKVSYSIVINVVLPTFLPLILTFIDAKLKIDSTSYWVSNITSEFLKNHHMSSILYSGLIVIIYIVVFIGLAIFVNKKREVK